MEEVENEDALGIEEAKAQYKTLTLQKLSMPLWRIYHSYTQTTTAI